MSGVPWKLKAKVLLGAAEETSPEGLSTDEIALVKRCACDAGAANVPIKPEVPSEAKVPIEAPDLRLRHPLSARPLEAQQQTSPSLPQNIDAETLDLQAYRELWQKVMCHPALQKQAASIILPDHSVAAHRSLTAALVGARRDGSEAALLYLHVGPVQSFIEAARRTHDLFIGSFTVAYLTFLGVQAIAEAEGPDAIVYPAVAELPLAKRALFNESYENRDGETDKRAELLRSSLPNKLLAIVPEGRADELAEKAAQAVRDGWMNMAKAVHCALDRLAPASDWDDGWDKQIADHLEIDAIVQPWSQKHAEVRALLQWAGTIGPFEWFLQDGNKPSGAAFGALFDLTHRVMSAHRKTVAATVVQGDCRPKCSQCGMREQMGPIEKNPAAQQRRTRQFFQELSQAHQAEKAGSSDDDNKRPSLQLDRGEGLCAVCLTKRFAPECYFGNNQDPFRIDWKHKEERFLLRFPSVPTIGSAPFRYQVRGSPAEKAAQELAGEIRKLPLGFDAPGNLMPGLGKLDRQDALRSLEGWWLYDSAYEPRTAWRNHRSETLDEEDPEYRSVRDRLPALRGKLATVCREAAARPSTYYAVLVLDGDHMGQWLTGRHRCTPRLGELNPVLPAELRDRPRPLYPALHGELSHRLGRLALALYEVVEQKYLGRIVYSGGDDLLALLPLQTVLPCLNAVRETIRSEEHLGDRVTVSAGIGITHVRAPLRTALRLAREAERVAKKDRNSFSIKVDKRSGGTVDLLLPFEANGDKDKRIDMLDAIRQLLRWSLPGEHALRSVSMAYRLREEADVLSALPVEAYRRRILTLLGKNWPQGHAWALLHESNLSVKTLADLLLFVRFLLREERGIKTRALLAALEEGQPR